jgi:hypothetical protein
MLPNIDVYDGRVASGRFREAAQDLYACGFARSVRSEEAEDLASVHLEADVIERPYVAVFLAQSIGFDQRNAPDELGQVGFIYHREAGIRIDNASLTRLK